MLVDSFTLDLTQMVLPTPFHIIAHVSTSVVAGQQCGAFCPSEAISFVFLTCHPEISHSGEFQSRRVSIYINGSMGLVRVIFGEEYSNLKMYCVEYHYTWWGELCVYYMNICNLLLYEATYYMQAYTSDSAFVCTSGVLLPHLSLPVAPTNISNSTCSPFDSKQPHEK